MTGLPNRELFFDRLEHCIAQGRRAGRRFAFMVVDLDRLKLVNDTLGHAVGDQLLVEVSRRLQRTLRVVDTVARVGGDEFFVILDD
ncbi:diguanylate cyclase (GGDEF)-like protein, partial [Peptococcaceae bacterium DYL19]|nr:diguanylate cyclase (GGDEF)-like protein [Phosphitispora fastidiosa]